MTFPEIREAVRRLCARFPGDYWRRLDDERAYPAAFVAALTAAGYLAALIPEDYGGSGLPLSAAAAILEEIHHAGCNGAACHAQMYIMGALLRFHPDHIDQFIRNQAELAALSKGRNAAAACASTCRLRWARCC